MLSELKRLRLANITIALAVSGLIVFACASCISPTGGSQTVAHVESDAEVTAAFDLNSYFLQSKGYAVMQVRVAVTGLPLYLIWANPNTVLIGHLKDPEYEWRGVIGDPVPAAAWPWVEALLTDDEIQGLGLVQAQSTGLTLEP